jgi:hypothetical protein
MAEDTKDVLDDINTAALEAYGVPLAEHDDPYFNDFLLAFARIRGHRERQAVAVPDGWKIAEELRTHLESWMLTEQDEDSIELMARSGRLISEHKAMFSAATPADTVKQDDYEAMKRDAERYRWLKRDVFLGDPFIARMSALSTVSRWTGTYADEAIDAAMSDCPHPIVEELTNE